MNENIILLFGDKPTKFSGNERADKGEPWEFSERTEIGGSTKPFVFRRISDGPLTMLKWCICRLYGGFTEVQVMIYEYEVEKPLFETMKFLTNVCIRLKNYGEPGLPNEFSCEVPGVISTTLKWKWHSPLDEQDRMNVQDSSEIAVLDVFIKRNG